MLDADKSGKISVSEFLISYYLIFLFLDIDHYFVEVLYLRKFGRKCLKMLMKMVIKKYHWMNLKILLKKLERKSKTNSKNDYFHLILIKIHK